MSKKAKSSHKERQTPETLRLRSISPVLTVHDLGESLAWYRDILRCHVADTWEEGGKMSGAALKAGTTSLVLLQDDRARKRSRAKGQGFRLYLRTVQDVDEIAAGIKERGGTLESEPVDMPWGDRAFSVVDPDGFRLTISSEG